MKRIAFLTGTRADWGKQRALVRAVRDLPGYDPVVYATGMHMLPGWGFTVHEIEKENVALYPHLNRVDRQELDLVISKTVEGMSDFVHQFRPDMIVLHGDRAEALAAAIVGRTNGIPVAHIEGGERSGSIDDRFRDAITAMADVHLVANEAAAMRVQLMSDGPVHVIGSPDLDAMREDVLPSWEETRTRYDLPEPPFGILLYHPVVGDHAETARGLGECLRYMGESNHDWICLYPNADPGNEPILKALESVPWKVYPSLRFDHFLRTLSKARVLLGNSSAGFHEAPYYGTRVVNVGTRQRGREVHTERGDGRSAKRFAEVLFGMWEGLAA